MPIRIFFNPINREITAEVGDRLLKRMQEEGVHIEALCGGKGICGKCKVILEEGAHFKGRVTMEEPAPILGPGAISAKAAVAGA